MPPAWVPLRTIGGSEGSLVGGRHRLTYSESENGYKDEQLGQGRMRREFKSRLNVDPSGNGPANGADPI
jgi:hypothetical protein